MAEKSATTAAAAPPVGNTGVQMTGAGLGWLQGTVRHVDAKLIRELLADALGSRPEPRMRGTRWYEESATIGQHVLVAWAPRSQPDRLETYFEVRQSGLDELGGEASLGLAASLLTVGAQLTRVDGYYDDQARHAEPETVAQAFRDGQVLSHLARVREIRQYQGRARPDGPMLAAGVTTYLGSPKSEGMVRVYD